MADGKKKNLEVLASLFLDGELSSDRREEVLSLIDDRPDFREMLRDYREQDRCLEDVESFVPPACPPMPRGRRAWRFMIVPAAACFAAVLFFVAGAFFGQGRALSRVPSFARVAAPAAWSEGRVVPAGQDFSPLTGLIAHYQAEVARELELPQPDWSRIRDLMVTLGSLRTDLELLSLHERYQKDPAGGASDWRRMLGMTEGESASL